jgi:AP-3 complex subunit delta-1
LSKKSKKKSKKAKKQDVVSDSGSEEETKPVHLVNKFVELPEGASLSDSEDKNELDLNDPHRALGNINLDDAEEFYAPPQRTSKVKHVEESESSKLKEKSHRKKKEQIPEQNLMIEEVVSEKKDKKKHKRKKEIISEDADHQKLTDILAVEQKVKKSKKKSKENDKQDTDKPKKHKKSSKKSEYEETL